MFMLHSNQIGLREDDSLEEIVILIVSSFLIIHNGTDIALYKLRILTY